MNTAVATQQDNELVNVLINSLYPGAKRENALMVIAYCRAAGLDVMQKPVHIVPMWNTNLGKMQDVIMPGISLYRVNAAKTNEHAGTSEPEFGPMVTAEIGGVSVTFPEWCKVSVQRLVQGTIATYTATEYWMENYAVKGGKEKSIAPNAMWMKRPRGQLAKCTEAQALRKGFPESCPAHTAEEMEGRTLTDEIIQQQPTQPKAKTGKTKNDPIEGESERMEEENPDAEGAEIKLIEEKHVKMIRTKLSGAGKTEEDLLKVMEVAKLEDLRFPNDLNNALAWITE